MLTTKQRLERLAAYLTEIRLWLIREQVNLRDWCFGGEPLALGQPWPERKGVHKLEHPSVHVPEHWALDASYLDLNVGGESLLTLHYPDAQERFGVNPHHEQFPLLARTLRVQLESVARFEFGVPNYAPRLERARLIYVDTAVERLHRLLTLVHETAEYLSDRDVAPHLLSAAEAALSALIWPSRTDVYTARTVDRLGTSAIWERPDATSDPPGLSDGERSSVENVCAKLIAALESLKQRYPKSGKLSLTGHAHLDLAWLWPVSETRRKGQRTLHGMLALLKRYPEFRFNQSSAQLYTWVEEDDPDLFTELRKVAETGQLEPLGATWVEPDTNMPSGESLVRQLLYGQRFFERTFGHTSEVCWLPDCFGFSPALPQLLRQAGVRYFFTAKLNWSETNPFPHDLFWWEGLDGSRVLAHSFENNPFFEGYNGQLRPATLLRTWENCAGKAHHPESLLSVGWGDGGGGTTREMLENARLLKHLPAVPDVQFDHVSAFYERAEASARANALPTWVGEMYLEYHRGTLTSQGRTKRLHRQAEHLLVAAEVATSMAHMLGGDAPTSLEPLWRDLLFSQFHDVLPGSSIREVYEETEPLLERVVARATEHLNEAAVSALQMVASPGEQEGVAVINPSLSPRPLRVVLGEPALGAQAVEDGYVLTGTREVAGLSVNVVTDAGEADELSVSETHLENALLRVELDESGVITQAFDKEHERDLLAGRGNQLWAYVDKPRRWDAWDVDADYRKQGEEITNVAGLEIIERGPHRAALRIRRRFRDSFITQDLRVWANSKRLEVATTLDWHDRRVLLKALFPLNVRAQQAHFECAFGVHTRPTHRNTPWDVAKFEVAQHRFAYLEEPGYGVALLNNGKYGVHALGNELGLSLLRSPVYPDYAADEGAQTFTYALYGDAPGSEESFHQRVLAEAEDLNMPLLARHVKVAEEATWRAAEVSGLPLGLGALKRSEESDDLILRVYEPHGARGDARVHLPGGWCVAEEVDGLEHAVGEPDFTFTPFQVRAYRLVKEG